MDTKRIISDALHELLKEKKIDNITVQNILDKAHVARSTFYCHFNDKFDLIAWYYKSFLDNLSEAENINMFTQNLILCMQFMKENNSYFKKILRSNNSKVLEDLLYTYSFTYYCKIYENYFKKDFVSPKRKLKIKLLCHGSSALVCDWILYGCADPPELVADVIAEMVPDEIKKLGLTV